MADDGKEPATWRFTNPKVFTEIIHSFKPKAVMRTLGFIF